MKNKKYRGYVLSSVFYLKIAAKVSSVGFNKLRKIL